MRPTLTAATILALAAAAHAAPQPPALVTGAARGLAAWSPDGREVAVAGADGRVEVHGALGGRLRRSLGEPGEALVQLAWSPDGERLAVADASGEVRVLDALRAQVLGRYRSRSGAACASMAFSADSRHLFVADAGGEGARLSAGASPSWGLSRGPWRAAPFTGAQSLSPQGDRLVVVDPGKSVSVVWVETGTVTPVARRAQDPRVAIFVGPDRILTAGSKTPLAVWSGDGRELASRGQPGGPAVTAVAYEPRGEQLLLADAAGALTLARGRWVAGDASGGALEPSWSWAAPGPGSAAKTLAFGPANRKVLAASEDGRAWVWPRGVGPGAPFTGGVAPAAAPAAAAPAVPSFAPGTRPGEVWEHPGGLAFVWIPPGTDRLGSPEGEDGRRVTEDAGPEVTLAHGFWMGRSEVTQAQWEAAGLVDRSRFDGPDLPVHGVTWAEAQQFCQVWTARERAAGRLAEGWVVRLPSEAEWEYAARAGHDGPWWGAQPAESVEAARQALGRYAVYRWSVSSAHPKAEDWTRYTSTHLPRTRASVVPAASRPANPWGLHDMLGNVREWVADAWHRDLSMAPADGRPYLDEDVRARILRGGGWRDDLPDVRLAVRDPAQPDRRERDVGLRVVVGRAW